ncbi:ATP-binding protein [Agrococcus sp. Marseille-Q4369]|uniref:ATP-binding protein n=1 Tax=Agrococcus sp. Marseille-Q4369 TaxID=2810513 RepID=UPI001B8BCF82|nr:ATP-binding protein [Agrococcus sp. Marseille-Q4369]QUW18022.1 ATP-binding protein [Agrococcus sp. Marseille-Q4369]
MSENPFRPTFGRTPPLLAGRDRLVAPFAETFRTGVWIPDRVSLVRGLRGIGKTVLLNAIEDAARRHRWLVISETARDGLADALAQTTLPALLRDNDPDGRRRELLGAGVSGASLSTRVVDEHQPEKALREQLTQLCGIAADRGAGVLITLDELHGDVLGEIRQLTIALQHLQREEAEIGFVAAGLPAGIEEVLQDKGTTFLRRAASVELDSLTLDETRRALREPIETAGRSIGDAALEEAALASRGYPFLVQAVGSFAWAAAPDDPEISTAAVREAARRAHRVLGTNVHGPSLSRLSFTDRTFLAAMALDDGPARMSDIADRMGVESRYASVYRHRLLLQGLIESAGWGKVAFTLPYLRDYLREHDVPSPLTRPARSTFPATEPDLTGAVDDVGDRTS